MPSHCLYQKHPLFVAFALSLPLSLSLFPLNSFNLETGTRWRRSRWQPLQVLSAGGASSLSIVCSSCYAPSSRSSSSHGCSCSPEACNGKHQAHGTGAPPPEGIHHHEPCTQKKPVKSNLKKAPQAAAVAQEEKNRVLVVSRKVTWTDAHGKDLAHVLEFHPSMLEDGNLKGAARSRICVIL